MANQSRLTRTCSVCGLEKPLAAFLQISGKQGTNYGTVCASCRATERTVKQTTSDEDNTSESKDKRIGSKEKVSHEQKRARQLKDLKELYIKAAKKREEEIVTKIEQTDIKEKAEKDHRKFYIETKHKQGFLTQKKPVDLTSVSHTTEQKQQLENAKNLLDNQHKVEIQKQEEIIKQELQVVSLDLSKPFIAGQTNQLRFQTDTFLKFKSWLGNTSFPIIKTLDFLYQKNPAVTQTKSPIFDNKSKTSKENIEDYIEKRLDNPSSTRRR